MATVEVTATSREAGTKGHARRLRMSGKIPGIVYGGDAGNIPIALDAPSFEKTVRHISSGNAILALAVEGREGEPLQVLIKEVQRNPVDLHILHVDLQQIEAGHRIRVHVPIHLTGTAVGVKEGGILEHLLREMELECLPSEIPAEITVEVTALGRGDSIHVRDIDLGNVHVLEAADRVVATVVAKAKEEPVPTEVAPAEETEAPAAGEEPAKGA